MKKTESVRKSGAVPPPINVSSICGCCGGVHDARHSRPSDPEWWGKSHWPTPMPHEKAGYRNGVSVPTTDSGVEESTSELPPKAKPTTTQSVTGLITLKDFMQEAKNLGVDTPELVTKLVAWFAKAERGECGAGMCRMQCNNLLKSAAKRLK